MSYMALYRKFRPTEFGDVKGQEHIVTTLKNQIKAERIGHAYLFCGTRGTGKTTIAKIFAKAVNCENPEEGNPFGVEAVIGYLVAKEIEFTAVRIIMSSRMAGIEGDTIRERLREAYV